MRFITLASSLVLLAACGASGKRPNSAGDAPTPYAVPVSAACVAEGGRPAPVVPLKQRYTLPQWQALAPGAKAQATAAQGGHRMNHADELGAATAACP